MGILNLTMLFILCLMMTPAAILMSMEDEEFEYLEPLPDYYAMLNVSHDASMKQIKRSFRKLAMEYHPDKNKTEGTQIVFQAMLMLQMQKFLMIIRIMLVSQAMKIKMYLKKQIRMIKVDKKTISILLNIIQKLMIVLRRFLKKFLKIFPKRLLNKLLKKIQKVEKMKILSMIWMTRLCTKS